MTAEPDARKSVLVAEIEINTMFNTFYDKFNKEHLKNSDIPCVLYRKFVYIILLYGHVSSALCSYIRSKVT